MLDRNRKDDDIILQIFKYDFTKGLYSRLHEVKRWKIDINVNCYIPGQ